MSVSLDRATEERIERQMARGIYREPADVVNRALDLLDSQEDWLLRNQGPVHEAIEEGWAQYERGDLLTPEEALEALAQDRRARAASRR